MRQHPDKSGTPQEKIIEKWLQKSGLRYIHQHPVLQYLIDFYVPEIETAIEADGIYGHLSKRDAKRDEELLSTEEVNRIWHIKSQKEQDIFNDLDDLLNQLFEETMNEHKEDEHQ